MKEIKPENPIKKMLDNLFLTQCIVIYDKITFISKKQEYEVLESIEKAYISESLAYPGKAPKFDYLAAIWSCKLLYYSAQLLVYRDHTEDIILELFGQYENEINAESILTADLCLRYIPSIIKQLELISIEDPLISILKNVLSKWPYSNLLYHKTLEIENLDTIISNNCLKSLFLNRIIENKIKIVSEDNKINQLISNEMGLYRNDFWPNFTL